MELLDYTQTKLKSEKVREDASEDRGEMNQQAKRPHSCLWYRQRTAFWGKSHFDRTMGSCAQYCSSCNLMVISCTQ